MIVLNIKKEDIKFTAHKNGNHYATIVVEKKNPTLLADGINELLLNENLKQKNIENAYNYVIDNLNINTIHQKLSKILYQIQKDE